MSIPIQRSFFEGSEPPKAAGQSEIIKQQSLLHAMGGANEISNAWVREAYIFLLNYSVTNPSFTSEDLRIASTGKVPDTGEARAWGSVMQLAARKGIIKKEGFKKGIMAHCHRATKTLWESQLSSGTKEEVPKKTINKKKYTLDNMVDSYLKGVEAGKTLKKEEQISEAKANYFKEKFNVKVK